MFQGQYESIQSMSFTSDNVEHIRVVCVALPVLDLKHPDNFITIVQLGVTWALASLTSAKRERGRRTLRRERSDASFLPAAFKVTAEKQPKCEFSSSEFQNKEKKSILLKHLSNRVHDQWIEYIEPWLNLSPCTLPCPLFTLSWLSEAGLWSVWPLSIAR